MRIRKAAPGETGSWPQFDTLKAYPGDERYERPNVLRYDARSHEKN